MPLDLQDLSPKPDFETIDSAQSRIPKLAVRGRTKASPGVTATTPSILNFTVPFSEKDSKESLRSSGENTLSPPSPFGAPTTVAPWDKEEKNFESRPTTTHSDSFTTSTSTRSETLKQPFRQEVRIINFQD